MQRSEKCSSTRQVALGLCNRCLFRENSHVVRRNIQNLIILPQRFGKTTLVQIGNRVLAEQTSVARVEPLGFIEIRLAPAPVASPPLQKRQCLKKPAAIRQKLSCLLKVTQR